MNTDNRKLRVALVGCGSISESHLRALIEEEDLSITALCDIRLESAEDKAKKYAPSARIYGDFDRMMEESDFDVLHITTPHYLHAPMAIAALAKDRNVFLEKPAEKRRIREIQIVRHLLYGHLRGLQLGLRIENNRLIDPLRNRPVTHLFHDCR